MIEAAANLKAIADYAGALVQMIEANDCCELQLDPTIFQRAVQNPLNSMVVPTGLEPVFPT
jgi:hypothetical protein